MKTFFTITLSFVMVCVLSSSAFSSEKFEDIYGSKIDRMISFYQARTYLIDSDYRVLSEIGRDAIEMIHYFQANREQLIEEMKGKQMYRSEKIKRYITHSARMGVKNKISVAGTGL